MITRFRSWLVLLTMLIPLAVTAQQTTEVYIPIGESPGVGDDESIIGSIVNVAYGEQRMTIAAAGETRTVAMTPKTRYYIDRSSQKARSEVGSYEDCETGMRVEVYLNDDGEAIWVKMQPDG